MKTNFLASYSSSLSSTSQSDYGVYWAQYSNSLKYFASSVIPEKKSIVVTSIVPREISSYGGEVITLTGLNLSSGTQKVVVKIQGVVCTIITKSATKITCLTGEKEYYNVLELTPTTVTIGNINAVILTEVIYVFNFKDRVKFTYFDNEILTSGNLYVPEQYGVILDVADVFPNASNVVQLNNIAVDGLLIITSSVDLTVLVDTFSGNGELRFGTETSRITKRVTFKVDTLSILNVSAFGRNSTSYNYELTSSAE